MKAGLRPDGTIVPRNGFIQPVQNRTNMRFQQKFVLPSRVQVDPIAEAFDLFNVANYTLGTQESSTPSCRSRPAVSSGRCSSGSGSGSKTIR